MRIQLKDFSTAEEMTSLALASDNVFMYFVFHVHRS